MEYLQHTADVRMKIKAGTIAALFEAGLKGMGNLLRHGACDSDEGEEVAHVFEVQSPDVTALLIDFLGEALTLCHAMKTVFCKVELENMTNTSLTAEVYGNRVPAFDEDIKAVTYHEANIHLNNKNEYETVIVFDI